MNARSKLNCRAVLLLLATGLSLRPNVSGQDPPTHFDVNDVSFLFPVPKSKTDAEALISMDEKLADGKSQLWPEEIFRQVMMAAKTIKSPTPGGPVEMKVRHPTVLEDPHLWKVAGIRVHPSALGVSDELRGFFGEAPTVRLIVQPVTDPPVGTPQPAAPVVHDVAVHIVFQFTLNTSDKPRPAIPDRTSFSAVVEDLRTIKRKVEGSVSTKGELKEHPGFRSTVALTQLLRELVKKHLTNERLEVISFMGIDKPEPWIFFPLRKDPQTNTFGVGQVRGNFVPAIQSQLFGFRAAPGRVFPVPTLNPDKGEGASTAILFRDDVQSLLDQPLFPGATDPKLAAQKNRDVADRVANPAISHNFNTDCVSCHTETTRRRELKLPSNPAVTYQRPEGISGVAEEVLPKLEERDSWNLRNFGWGLTFFGPPRNTFTATVTQRAANEAADSAAFINQHYLAQHAVQQPAVPKMAATPLTLIMDIKSKESFNALKEMLANIEKAPPAQNKIRVALDRIRLVHFARFVFIGEDKLAVITTFDGRLDDYIGAFAEEIGDIFNALLAHVKDAPPLPVQANESAFLQFVKGHDAKASSFYSAYPSLTTQAILSLQPRPAEGTSPK